MGKTMAGLVLLLVGRIEMQTELQESLGDTGRCSSWSVRPHTVRDSRAARAETCARQIMKRMSGGGLSRFHPSTVKLA